MDNAKLIAVYDKLSEKIAKLAEDQKALSIQPTNTKGLEAALKAQSKDIQSALKALSELSDAKIQTLATSIPIQPNVTEEAIRNLTNALQTTQIVEKEPVQFKIKRDSRGLIETVIATPFNSDHALI